MNWKTNRRFAALCAIAKNEAPYLAEWAIYHRLIGFDKILVYENESTDTTQIILTELSNKGVINAMPWKTRPGGTTQKLAYANGLQKLAGYEWLAFFDVDEFLYIPAFSNSLDQFLASYESLDAIAINWSLFGTSDQQKKLPGLVVERFKKRARSEHSANRAVKTLAKTRSLVKPNLHNHTFAPGVTYQTVDGQIIEPGTGRSERVTHDIVRLNHYFIKSREEWDAKVARGRATKPEGHPDKFRRENNFKQNNKNDVIDDAVASYAPLIRSKAAELGLSESIFDGLV